MPKEDSNSEDFSFLQDHDAVADSNDDGLPTPNLAGLPDDSEPAELPDLRMAVEKEPVAAEMTSSDQSEAGRTERRRARGSRGTSEQQPAPAVAASESPNETQKNCVWLVGYAAGMTVLFLILLLSGRIQLNPNHQLESLPDIRPLAPNEFKLVPETAQLPAGHELRLGQTQRFGDVTVTPVRVTREVLRFEQFDTGVAEESLTTSSVLKLWLRIRNVSEDIAFPPFDAGLMSLRNPRYSASPETQASSALWVERPDTSESRRILNFLQDPNSNFVLSGQSSGRVLNPGEEFETFAASETLPEAGAETAEMRWRVQIRKGVNSESGHGVTTLIDFVFSGEDIVDGDVEDG